MAIIYLKKASKNPGTETANAQTVVNEMLGQIQARGEDAVREYAEKLDRWTGPIEVTDEELERRTKDIPASIKSDIEFAFHFGDETILRNRNTSRLNFSA